MEEYVEEADSQRLAAASRVGELEQQLASVRRGEDDTYSQVGGGYVCGVWCGCAAVCA